jgi:putative FmdB family regulatory protein
MPTYDYRCNACDYTFELFQSISERLVRKCPECGKPKLERLFGAGGAVLFKGSGFYQTDYRSSEYKSKLKTENDSAKPDTKSKDKTSDEKN